MNKINEYNGILSFSEWLMEANLTIADVHKHDYKYIKLLIDRIKSGEEVIVNNKSAVVFDYDNMIMALEKAVNDDNQSDINKLLMSGNRYAEIFTDKNIGKKYGLSKIFKGQFSQSGIKNKLGRKLSDGAELATVQAIINYANNIPTTPENIGQDIFIEYFDLFDDWEQTFIETPKIINNIVKYDLKAYEILHDGSKNILSDIIKSIVKLHRGSKDAWNPADIWVIKKSEIPGILEGFKNILAADVDDDTKLQLINSFIIKQYEDGYLYPFSLKQITAKTAKYELTNLDKNNIELYNFAIHKLPADFEFDERKNQFKTKEIGVFEFLNIDTDKKLTMQIRAFPHEFSTVQTEITSSGEKTGGRVGKVPTYIVDSVLNKYGENRIKSIKFFNNMRLTQSQIESFSIMYENITNGNKYFRDNINNWLQLASEIQDVKVDLVVKLQGLLICDIFWRNKENISDIINSFLLGAKKLSPTAGFFIKIF